MRETCSTHVDGKCIQHSTWKPVEKRAIWRTGIDGRIILKWTLKEKEVRLWIGFDWLRLGPSGRLLWTRLWILGLHKMLRVSWAAVRLTVSHERLCSRLMGLVRTSECKTRAVLLHQNSQSNILLVRLVTDLWIHNRYCSDCPFIVFRCIFTS
jgi:hypothetical protein